MLAWHLGSPAGPQELDYLRRWAGMVRERDPAHRPADHRRAARRLAAGESDWPTYSWPITRRPAVCRRRTSPSGSIGLPLWLGRARRFGPAFPRSPGPRAGNKLPRYRLDRRRHARDSTMHKSIRWSSPRRPTVVADSCSNPIRRSMPTTMSPSVARCSSNMLNDRLDMIGRGSRSASGSARRRRPTHRPTAIVLQVERARLLVPTSWDARSPVDVKPSRAERCLHRARRPRVERGVS